MQTESVVIAPLTCGGRAAASMLGCGITTLKKLVERGEIVPIRVDGFAPRYSIEQLRAWVRKRSGVLTADEE
jgi:hypothetical protein